jgi:diadenosine tetraphosphate (Ap4A) HIT family hydrolase
MPDDLPPQEVFDALCELYSKIAENTQKLPKGSREYLVALVILSTKAMRHTFEALRILGEHRAIGESIILVRSAYEAAVVFLYLIDYEEEFERYKGFSQLVSHRNQLEMLEIAAEEMASEDIQEQQAKNKAVKDEIITSGYHTLFGIDEMDVSNLDKLRKTVSRAHFTSFNVMLKHLERDKQFQGLVIGGFHGYNVGSQIAHSHYHVSVPLYIFDEAHPAYDMRAICGQIRDLFIYIAIGLRKLNLLNADTYSNELAPHLLKTVKIMQEVEWNRRGTLTNSQ